MRRGNLMLHIAVNAAQGKPMRLTAAEVVEVRRAIGQVALSAVSPLAVARKRLTLDEDGDCPDWTKVDPVNDAAQDDEPRSLEDSGVLCDYLRANGFDPKI